MSKDKKKQGGGAKGNPRDSYVEAKTYAEAEKITADINADHLGNTAPQDNHGISTTKKESVARAAQAAEDEGIPAPATGINGVLDDGTSLLDELAAEDAVRVFTDKDDDDGSSIDTQREAADQRRADARKDALRRHRIHFNDLKDLAPVKRQALFRWGLGAFLIGVLFLVCSCVYLHDCGMQERQDWMSDDPTNMNFKQDLAHAEAAAAAGNATQVEVGTYVEHIDSVSIKDSKYTYTLVAWYKWQGDKDLDIANNVYFYRSGKATVEMLREMDEGDTHYQLARYTVASNKVFHTARFPLEDHQLRIFLEAVYPVRDVVFVQSDDASTINDDMKIAGYDITDVDYAVSAHQYDSLEGDWTRTEPITCSEYITAVTIERSGFGLYLKCFMAMYGTSLWVIIMLYICGNHRVDPLGMIPAALFGTVSNIMVGASLLPDALDMGLLEIVNCWGILTILAVTTAVIQINHLRSEYGRKDEAFARFFGRLMFAIIATLAVVGNIVLPLAALL